MLNQSTINGTRIVVGSVITTVNAPVVGGVRFDRADSQPKHLGKRLHQRRLPALSNERRLPALRDEHRLAAVRSRHASAASYSCLAQAPAALRCAFAPSAQVWQMRMPAGRLGQAGAMAPSELPAGAWASLVLARAV